MRGHIRKRGSTWSIVYDERPDPETGERRQRERGGYQSHDEAATALAEAIAAVKTGGYVRPDEVTVATFLRDWLRRKAEDDVKQTTAASYRSKIETHLVPRLGALRVQDLDVGMIEDTLREIHREGGRGGKPLSLRTVDYCRVLLRGALDDAERRGLIPSNPARLARIPSKQHPDWEPRNAPQAPWTLAELRKWMTVAAEDRLAALWTVYATTGMRRGEALALLWKDVDLDAGTAYVHRNRVAAQLEEQGRTVYDEESPKTDASVRTVTLDAATVAALRTHRAEQAQERLAAGPAWSDEGRVFALEDGTGLDPDAVSQRFRDMCDAAGLRRIRPHDVRHTMATRMLEAGEPVEVVSKRLGHARTSVTLDMYVHPDDAQQRAASDRFGDLLAGGEQA